MKRLTRRDKSRRGQDGGNDPSQRQQAHMLVPEAAATTSSACSSPSQSDIVGHEVLLRRRTLLFEDHHQWEPQHLRNAISSCPDLNEDSRVSGRRSVPLHPKASALFQSESIFPFEIFCNSKFNFFCEPFVTKFCSLKVQGSQIQ